MMVDTKTSSPNAILTEIEQRIVEFLVAREAKLRGELVGKWGVERERLISAMLETFWLRRALESGEMLAERDC